MKLMMLGAASAQLSGILKAKEMGHTVVTCDYYKTAIGHQYADESTITSTFDVEAVFNKAKEFNIDGIMTLGTDQPVYTAAYVANHLGLPSMITEATALAVTNKIVMKERLTANNIRMVHYMVYEKGVNEAELDEMAYPVVVKPIDSQGQRGLFYLEDAKAVREHYYKVIEHSRLKQIMVEAYYEHDEITVSGWVDEGNVHILTITDRVTFDGVENIGICLSHEFPSKHMSEHGDELIELTKRIVQVCGIKNGPIYFQLFIGKDGILVNEIACRIGGAYEATFIPEITGFDICLANIQKALGQNIDTTMLNVYDIKKNVNYLSVQLFFASTCIIHNLPTDETIRSLDGVVEVGYNISKGDVLKPISNATSRAGYVIVKAKTKQALEERLIKLYDVLKILDLKGKNHIIHRKIVI